MKEGSEKDEKEGAVVGRPNEGLPPPHPTSVRDRPLGPPRQQARLIVT